MVKAPFGNAVQTTFYEISKKIGFNLTFFCIFKSFDMLISKIIF